MLITLNIIVVLWVTYLLSILWSGRRNGDDGSQKSRKFCISVLENKLIVITHSTFGTLINNCSDSLLSLSLCFVAF